MALTKAIEQLRMELKSKEGEITQISKAIKLLSGSEVLQRPGKHRGHKMSPEAIEKIRTAAKKRWAEKRKALKK